MTREQAIEAVIDIIKEQYGISDSKLLKMHNSLPEANEIYEMGDFNDVIKDLGYSPLGLVESLDRDFDTTAELFFIDDYDGTIMSVDNLYNDYCPFDIDKIAEYIVDTGDDFGVSSLKELLEEYENYYEV